MKISILLGILGTSLTIIEIYFPAFADRIEGSIDRVGDKLIQISKRINILIKEFAYRFVEDWDDWLRRFGIVFLILIISNLVIKNFPDFELQTKDGGESIPIIGSTLAIVFLIVFIAALWHLVLILISLLFRFLYFTIIFPTSRTISVLNLLTKGRALGAIGLLAGIWSLVIELLAQMP